MEAVPISPDSQALCQAVQSKLQKWGGLGEAPEYFQLKNRCVAIPPSQNTTRATLHRVTHALRGSSI